jgi:hypothetical protein
MPESEKRKVSARQILTDIRSGMGDSELQRKHSLSDRSLEKVYRRLLTAGALTEAYMRDRGLTVPSPTDSSKEDGEASGWQCPSCGARQPKEVPECPVCGVVVSKYVARQTGEEEIPIFMPNADGAKRRSWIPGVGLVVVVVLVGSAWLLWPEHRAKERPKIAATQVKPEPVELVGDEIELQFSKKGFPLGLSVSQGFALHLFEAPGKSQGFKKMPPKTDAKRYYDEFKIAGRTFLVITEASKPPKMYLDANRNGDLTDDPGPFAGESPRVVPNHYELLLPYKQEDEVVPYRMWLFSSRMGGVRFYPKCHWHGVLSIDGRDYGIVLFDANADGDYSNDSAVIDIDNNGKADENEILKPGDGTEIDGTEVKLISIAPSGRWVRLEF